MANLRAVRSWVCHDNLLPPALASPPWPLTNTHPGGTNHALDLQNPDNLGRQSTDGGRVKSLKWSFSEGKTNIYNGGWVREQVITDLPQSHDIAGAQLHLKKGALRELHWHTTVCAL